MRCCGLTAGGHLRLSVCTPHAIRAILQVLPASRHTTGSAMPNVPNDQPKKLTAKQELFVAAYLGEAKGNATEAARIAGYAKPAEQGYENLRKPHISARVRQELEKFNVSADAVLQELARVAFAEWHDFVEVVGRAKDGEVTKVRSDIGSKVKALELLGKYHQLFTEKQEVNVNVRRHEVVGVTQDALDRMFMPASDRADA